LTGADTTKSTIHVTEKSAFPKVCCTCNSPTEDTVQVVEHGEVKSGEGTAGCAQAVVFVIVGIVLWLFGGPIIGIIYILLGAIYTVALRRVRPGHATTSMRVKIPQCKVCASKDRIVARSFDAHHYSMSFLVDKRFAEHFRRLNDVS
jgi:hypothetical protein